MAVQAQHPSNILLLNRAVPDPTFDNPSQVFSNGGDRNQRKRPRDDLNLEEIIAQQSEEMSQMLRFHADEMRRVLAERRQRQILTLMEMASESLGCRLREKEREMERASRSNAELEARAAQLRMEAQLWQAKAQANETAAALLRAQLQQAVASCARDDGRVDAHVDDESSAYVDPDRVTCCSPRAMGPVCRACHVAVARVVVLPCRHLCLCSDCGVAANSCPVCFQVRNSSVEVFLC